jgi:predicted enzyme related to lactoylglutathione lyase
MTTKQAVVNSFDHSVVPVMDVWRAERFYTMALDGAIMIKVGMVFPEDDRSGFDHPPGAFVKLGRQHLGLFGQNRTRVYPPASPEAGYPCWGLFVAAEDFDKIVARVPQFGGTVAKKEQTGYGQIRMRSVRCLDSEGNCIELVADPRGRFNGLSVTGLSHMHMETQDLTGTADFYKKFLGADMVDADEEAGWIAMGLPSGQHLFFHQVKALSPATIGPYIARHIAFSSSDEPWRVLKGRWDDAGLKQFDMVPGNRRPGDLDAYFDEPNKFTVQVTNGNSMSLGARPKYRYVAA